MSEEYTQNQLDMMSDHLARQIVKTIIAVTDDFDIMPDHPMVEETVSLILASMATTIDVHRTGEVNGTPEGQQEALKRITKKAEEIFSSDRYAVSKAYIDPQLPTASGNN